MDIIEKFKKKAKPLVLDGAMGSLLEQRGLITNDRLWSTKALMTNELEVFKIHKEYLEAGADIVTTNTFRTNPAAFVDINNYEYKKYVKKAVSICKSAAEEFNEIVIAGSNPPAEDCYQTSRTISKNDLLENHKRHIDELYTNGVDVIFNETFSHRDEIVIVSKYCSQNKIPFVISLYLTETNKLLSGESFESILKEVKSYNPIAISINCISLKSFKKINKKYLHDYLNGFYLNCLGDDKGNNIKCSIDLEDYKEILLENLNNNLLFVGSCCGSDSRFTKMIKDTIDELYKN